MRFFSLIVAVVFVSVGRSAPPEEHWAWKPATRPAVPIVRETANPIDSFIRARLEGAGLAPVPRAKREQLVRRVTFDLTGLPPTPEEVDAFVQDQSSNAWEKVVD